ncbi:hypothetical protein KAU11_03425 [Candidatus Babeliales bacterium]|nr:hypothetical protein [Candidatus Babeliales bacterium]
MMNNAIILTVNVVSTMAGVVVKGLAIDSKHICSAKHRHKTMALSMDFSKNTHVFVK